MFESVTTITLDDLLPLIKTDRAFIKADVQGTEIRIFNERTAGKFFDSVHVPFVLMEWDFYRPEWSDPVRKKKIDDWLEFFYKRNYVPYCDVTFQRHAPDWSKWGANVLFRLHT